MKKNKTLEESAKKLKESVDRFHEAKVGFINAYVRSITKYDDMESWADPSQIYFHKKFGEKLVIHDLTQE